MKVSIDQKPFENKYEGEYASFCTLATESDTIIPVFYLTRDLQDKKFKELVSKVDHFARLGAGYIRNDSMIKTHYAFNSDHYLNKLYRYADKKGIKLFETSAEAKQYLIKESNFDLTE